jgi:hypothetical protein
MRACQHEPTLDGWPNLIPWEPFEQLFLVI